MPSSGPSSPRLVLNSPPLDHRSISNDTGGSYLPQTIKEASQSNCRHPHGGPGPLYPPGQRPRSPQSPKATSGPSNVEANGLNQGQGHGRTPAEAYANLHTQQQSKRHLPDHPYKDHQNAHPTQYQQQQYQQQQYQQQQQQPQQLKERGTKPVILDWISRKLGSRRATISETPSSSSAPHAANGQRMMAGLGGSPKLGGGSSNGGRNRLPSMPKPSTTTTNTTKSPRKAGAGPSAGGETVGMINMRRENSSTSNSTQPSLSLYSTRISNVGTVERDRRREANNPYPSIPIPKLIASSGIGLRDTIKRKNGRNQIAHTHTHTHTTSNANPGPNSNADANNHLNRLTREEDGETNTTVSMSYSYSYLSRSPRSRSYSMDSIRSSTNSYARSLDDNARPTRFRGRTSTNGTNERPISASGGYMAFVNTAVGGGTGAGADDDASLRPFPPSHPGSPTPSTSVLSRTGSNAFPPPTSRQFDGGRSRTNTFYSTWSGAGHARSTTGSLDGLYGSTYRYSYDRQPDDQDEDEDEDENDGRERESRQDSTSTKPTTCISFDSSPAIAHIAQPQAQLQLQPQQNQLHIQLPISSHSSTQTPIAPQGSFGLGDVITSSPNSDPSRQRDRSSRAESPLAAHEHEISSGGSSPAPPSPTTPTSNTTSSPTRPTLPIPPNSNSNYHNQGPDPHSHPHVHVQAPKHTPHHPVHNPIPNEVPDDNASMLTLASSTFGLLPTQIGSPLNHNPSHASAITRSGNASASGSGSITPHTPTVSQPLTPNAEIQETPQSQQASMAPPPTSTAAFAIPNPPSIHRLKETSAAAVAAAGGASSGRPSSITSPSIHWAPTPTSINPATNTITNTTANPAEERDRERDRPLSVNFENSAMNHQYGYQQQYQYQYQPSINTHLSTAASIMSFKRADRDASVRAIRRKGSWESYESGWSWRGLNGPTGGGGGDGWSINTNTNTNNRNLASPIGGTSSANGAGAGAGNGAGAGSANGAGSFRSGGGMVHKADSVMSRDPDRDNAANDDEDVYEAQNQERNLSIGGNGLAIVAS
nr:uncharacterized protein I303_03757 [Kwoniella dejecticola CBS 10117]OBR86039.1 hypothetical protein I303_03757 [Kwoniella dejecticola CBS 10117]